MSSLVFSVESESKSSNGYAALRNMQQQGELCDAILEVDSGERISVHRCVMAARSAYFKAMFTNGLAESNQTLVPIREIEYDVLSSIVAFCYFDEFSVSANNVLPLLIASDLLQINALFCECSQFLETQLHPGNVLSLREHARLHNCWRLFHMCSDFVFRNFKEVAEREEFLDLPSDQLLEVVSNDQVRVSCEEDIYCAVTRWVYNDLERRRNCFTQLMSHVRLAFVSADFLSSEVEGENLMQDKDCQLFLAEARLYKSSPEKRGYLRRSQRTKPRRLSGLQEVILVAGGMSGRDGAIQTLEQYDSRTDTWSTLSELSRSRYALAACFHAGHLYISGGCCETLGLTSLVECYSMKESKWTVKAPLDIARRYHGMVVLLGLLYVVGGQNSHGVLCSVERYNPSEDAWTKAASLSCRRMYHGTAEAAGKIFAAGGHSGTERLSSVEVYNPLTDEWSYAASLHSPRSVMGMTLLSTSLYIAGGYDGSKHLNTVERYDLKLEAWVTCASMNKARSAFGLVAYNNCLYACGGFNQSFLSSVEAYNVKDDTWQPVASMINERVHYSITVT